MRELIIEPGRAESQYWRDLWSYRELFYFLAWRDILVRYKQTVIGIAWALIRPFLTMVVFTVVFAKLAHLPSAGAPYPILVLAGLLPWQFFATAVSESGNSLVSNANLISKVYFPRIIAPVSAVIVASCDFLICAAFLAALMAWWRFVPTMRILALPFFALLAVAASIGVGLWFAALNVKYRDVRHLIPFIVQFGAYISPVGFSSNLVPQKWRLAYSMNPMVAVIDGFRWSILGTTDLYVPGLMLSCLMVFALCFTGWRYFRRTENTIADLI